LIGSLSSTYRLLHRIKLSWLAPRPRHPQADATAQAAFSQLLGLQLERVRAAQAPGTRVEVWVSGRGSHRPEEQPDPGVGATGSRPVAPKDLGFASGLFVWCGLPVGGQSGGADHADLQYRRHETTISARSAAKSPLMPMPW